MGPRSSSVSSALAATNGASIGGGTIVLPEQNTWVDFQAPGTACTSGVSLTYDHVGVWSGGMLTNTVQACGGAATPCTPPDDTNTFRAELQNVPNTLGPTNHAVRAQVPHRRLGFHDRELEARSVEGHSRLPSGCFHRPDLARELHLVVHRRWRRLRRRDHPIHLRRAGSRRLLPQAHEPRRLPSPVHAGRGSARAPRLQTLTFQTAAVYRNMEISRSLDPGPKSAHRREGVAAAARCKQGIDDVYLHVQTLNMPAHGKEPIWLPSKAMALARPLCGAPSALLGQPVPDVGNEEGDRRKGRRARKAGAPKAPSKPGNKTAQLAPAPKPSEPPAPAGQAAAQRFRTPNFRCSTFRS